MAPEGNAAEPSRHKCLIYDGHPSEQLPVIVPLLLDGIRDRWRTLYLGDPDTLQMVDTALSEQGVDTAQKTREGALVLSADRTHLAGGRFDPQAMVDGLRTAIDGAVAEGFGGLCATGDMTWELGTDENFTYLLEYEARLDRVFREKPLRGICQYRRDLVPHEAIRHALLTHRSLYVGDVLNQDNLFYIPPELLLDQGSGGRDRQGDWMCQQILRVLHAERTRDEALRALEATNRDLERRVAERTAELEASNRDLDAFAYSVSHDLRAPLRAIGGFASALVEDAGPSLGSPAGDHLARIRAAVARMEALVDGLLTLSRTVHGTLQRTSLDLTAMADEILHELQALAPERAADLVIQLGLRATGDPVLVRAALTNLLNNAWKFTQRRPKARIEVGQERDALGHGVYFVRDNGAGFDAAYASKLFTPFQRLHGPDEYPGTGIGLATVGRIIARHGGRVWAEGAPEGGATFFFTLPEAAPPDP